ncbi:cytochrome c oxidase subunit II [Myxococcota bacterium]|nr:cytochrome c oxidase subunit II [Myxococcota bacterium]
MNALNHLIATATFWMPRQASDVAVELDNVFYFIYYLSVIFFVGIIAAMVYFSLRYRRKSADQRTSPIAHSNTLELWWTAIPTVLLAVIFFWGFKAWVTLNVPPANAMEIQVRAWKWGWEFTYNTPNTTFTSPNLYVPEKKPIKLVMTSNDVLHSFYLPEFRIKRDVIPKRSTVLWFEARQATGTWPEETARKQDPKTGKWGDVSLSKPYNLFCAEYCGQQHSMMMRKVYVLSQAHYEKWVAEKEKDAGSDKPLDVLGQELYTSKTCNTCHSVDGTAVLGPSFKGRYGAKIEFADGTSGQMDDDYIIESIEYPNRKIAKGFPAAMPTFKGQLDAKQLRALVAYIQSVNGKYNAQKK